MYASYHGRQGITNIVVKHDKIDDRYDLYFCPNIVVFLNSDEVNELVEKLAAAGAISLEAVGGLLTKDAV